MNENFDNLVCYSVSCESVPLNFTLTASANKVEFLQLQSKTQTPGQLSIASWPVISFC